jgi:predicted type IV restriction endonuclease
MSVSAKIVDRITSQLKRYQGVLNQALQRDINESDTVLIVSDMLADVFGYTKYEHITTEHVIRGTFVDLAIKVDEELRFLIEVKAIGVALKDSHVKQAVDYGANKGVEWVILTNGIVWRVYKIVFGQPIEKELITEVDIVSVSTRDHEVLECFSNLSKEGFSKGSMTDLLQQKQVTSKFALASVLLSDAMVEELRRELRRLSPGLRVDVEGLRTTLAEQVIKRELIDSEDALAAQAAVKRLMRALAREKSKRAADGVDKDRAIDGDSTPAAESA